MVQPPHALTGFMLHACTPGPVGGRAAGTLGSKHMPVEMDKEKGLVVLPHVHTGQARLSAFTPAT